MRVHYSFQLLKFGPQLFFFQPVTLFFNEAKAGKMVNGFVNKKQEKKNNHRIKDGGANDTHGKLRIVYIDVGTIGTIHFKLAVGSVVSNGFTKDKNKRSGKATCCKKSYNSFEPYVLTTKPGTAFIHQVAADFANGNNGKNINDVGADDVFSGRKKYIDKQAAWNGRK